MAKGRTYWNNTGRYQALYTKFGELIPGEGSVPNTKDNPALEKLRKAANCYHDLYNNGLCNRATEFRKVFGFGGVWIAKEGFPRCAKLEGKMDEIILNASKEQGVEKI